MSAGDGEAAGKPVRIPAADGVGLAATIYGDGALHGTALLVPATGVVQRLYAAYGRYLASRGFAAVTWDWRGTGESRPASLRGFHCTMRDWGEKDLAGVIDWARASLPGPLVAVTHSFGGQALGLAHNRSAIARIVTVGSQVGYMGLWPAPMRYRLALLWYVVVPALTRLAGYFPSRRFGLGEDLPRGVALQWAAWCKTPEYLGTWEGHGAIRAPLLAICFSDDAFAPRAAWERLHAYYGSETRRMRWITPAEVRRDYVGHFGFYREGLVPEVWEETVRWLAATGA